MDNAYKSIAETIAGSEHSMRRMSRMYLIVFVLLALFSIGFGWMWRNTAKRLDENAVQLKKQSDSLEVLNSFVARQLETYAILQRKYDTALRKIAPQVARSLDSNIRQNMVVYVQYSGESRPVAQSVEQVLEQKGYNLPASEQMTNANFGNSVKYFREEDEAKARQVAATINATQELKARPVKVVRQNLKAPPGQIEVWLGDPKDEREQRVQKTY
jgi:hypothetical protein